MKITLFFLLLAFVSLHGVFASPVDPVRAARVATHFWLSQSGAKGDVMLVDCSRQWPYDGIYIFCHPDGGYVLVAADDCAEPVLGYSFTSPVDPANLPVPMASLVQGYQRQIELLRESPAGEGRAENGMRLQGTAERWSRLEDSVPTAPMKSGVGPLLATMWDQNRPYNDLCPEVDGIRCLTGCAATAQAMVMKYWNYPPFGIGSHAYSDATLGTISAQFNRQLYDWDNMTVSPNQYSPEVQRLAVARLMFHIGVSLEMYYSPTASGAQGLSDNPGEHNMNNSLTNVFHYSRSMRVVERDRFASDQSWRDTLIAELDLRHPILYTGSDDQGGHAFVCDGYDSDKKLHFNFGWSGMGNGFFTVGNIAPGVAGTGSNASNTFNQQNMALLGTVPDPAPLISDTALFFQRDGGTDSLWLALADGGNWAAQCSSDWIRLDDTAFSRIGWLTVSVDPNDDGCERVGFVTFSHNGTSSRLRVVQDYYSPEQQCAVTLILRNNGPAVWGWRGGAAVALRSLGGKTYVTASITQGNADTVAVGVDPKDLVVEWIPGGTTDQLAGYTLLNPYGEILVNVDNALEAPSSYLVPWPCTHIDIDDIHPSQPRLAPNPTSGRVHIENTEPISVDVLDLCGRRLLHFDHADPDLSSLPQGLYFLRITSPDSSSLLKVVKADN